jgi:hypothetical protein
MSTKKNNPGVPVGDLVEGGDPERRGRVADPLGDPSHVVPGGELTAQHRPEREGLLRSGSMPKTDGGVDQHPTHDEDQDDMGPDEYEEEFDEARNTGFEPVEDDEGEPTGDEDEEDRG